MSLSLTRKLTTEGKQSEEVAMNGNTLSKQVFNGDSGYLMMRGQKIDLNEQQIKDTKATSGLFPELNINEGAELAAIETVNDEEAYVIQLTDNVREFYSVETGLKLATETTAEQMGQKMTSTVSYLDYAEKNGVMVPMTFSQNLGPQTVDFNMEEVMFNKDVSEADFE
jgi:hypothetical protein